MVRPDLCSKHGPNGTAKMSEPPLLCLGYRTDGDLRDMMVFAHAGEVARTDLEFDQQIVDALKRHIVSSLTPRLCASMPMLSWHGARDDGGGTTSAGGSAFLIRTSSRVIGVTAKHVVTSYAKARDAAKDLMATLGGLNIDLQERVITCGRCVDVATFVVEEIELPKIGFQPIEAAWPPAVPLDNGDVLLAGWPGQERIVGADRMTGGIYVGWGTARVTDRQITVRVDHDRGAIPPLPSVPLPPPGFDFGGISGGPLMTISVEGTSVVWRLGGVIVEGEPALDYIVAARADVIRGDDGTIDA